MREVKIAERDGRVLRRDWEDLVRAAVQEDRLPVLALTGPARRRLLVVDQHDLYDVAASLAADRPGHGAGLFRIARLLRDGLSREGLPPW